MIKLSATTMHVWACILSAISFNAAIPSYDRINADYTIADEGKETRRRGGIITFRILIPWIYGHDFRFEIIDRRKPQWNETEWNIGRRSFNSEREKGREEEEKREKGARLVPALPNAPAAIYCLKPSAGPFMRPTRIFWASPVTDFKQTIIAGYACDYGTSFPYVRSFRFNDCWHSRIQLISCGVWWPIESYFMRVRAHFLSYNIKNITFMPYKKSEVHELQ